MYSSAVMVFYLLLLLSPVTCDPEDSARNEIIREFIRLEKITEKIQEGLWDTNEGRLVALKMFDASSKIPTGLLTGNFFDLGNFDECYDIKYEDVYGKYCLGTLKLTAETQKYFEALIANTTSQKLSFVRPEAKLEALGSEEYMGFHFATCVPSNWSAEDIPGFLTYSESFCYSKATAPKLSSGAILTIVILSIIFTIVFVSTVFDIVLYYNETEPPHQLLIAFSAWTNGRKIFKTASNSDQMLCLNGIKAISTMWVIIAHEYANVLNAAMSNVFDFIEFEREAKNMFVLEATVSVDTFFVVAGLVTVYIFLKSLDKGVKFNIIFYYIHRYLRLTPAFAIMALIHLYLINYFGNGPLWGVVDSALVKPCEEGWWSSFLYITNYVQHGMCLPQSWYLSVDMQLFLVSPIILIPLSKRPRVALGLLGILAVAGCVVPFSVGFVENLGPMVTFNPNNEMFKYINHYYLQTYTRFGPYVIGMMLGYFLHKMEKSKLKIQLSKLIVCCLWLVCLTVLTACVYAGHPLILATEADRWGNSLFLAFNRQAWSVAVAGVIFLCVAGYGGPIDKFLSLPIFQILAKLSYPMYLIHYAVIVLRYSAMRNVLQFSHFNTMHAFWGDFMITFALSLILSLSFESPIIILEKYLFGRASASGKKPEA